MSLLKALENTDLTDYVIKLLKNHKITKVLEFINEDAKKLSDITNLSIKEILKIKKKIAKNYGPHLINLYNHYGNYLNKFEVISTGITSLDSLLNGGLLTGNIVDICGFPCVGKTHFCITLTINILSEQINAEALYIDTKKDFSGQRMHNILNARQFDTTKIGLIMQRTKVERIYDAYSLINLLKLLYEKKEILQNLKLLIIDSLPALMLQYCGENKGISLLVEVTNLIKKIAQDRQICVVVVNIITRWMALEKDDEPSTSKESSKPCLGSYWKSSPSLRLTMEEINEKNSNKFNISTSNNRVIKLAKSNTNQSGGTCNILLINGGII